MVFTYYLGTYIYKPNVEIIKCCFFYYCYLVIFCRLFERKKSFCSTYLTYDEKKDIYI